MIKTTWEKLPEGAKFCPTHMGTSLYRKDEDTGYFLGIMNTTNLATGEKCWYDPYSEVYQVDDSFVVKPSTGEAIGLSPEASTKPVVQMVNWSVVSAGGGEYSAPEMFYPILHGDTIDHPRFGSRNDVRTTRILGSEDRKVETRNTIYLLVGDPRPSYLVYLKAIGKEIDDARPVKIFDRG